MFLYQNPEWLNAVRGSLLEVNSIYCLNEWHCRKKLVIFSNMAYNEKKSSDISDREEISMYCIRCGRQLQDGVKYCIFCGSPTAEGRKAQSAKKQDTASIPMDFFSSRINPEQEDTFDIAIPEDFIQSAPEKQAQQPDATEIPAMELDDAQTPQDIEDEAYTRMISREELQAARAAVVQQNNTIEEKTATADAPGSLHVTDVPDNSEMIDIPESSDHADIPDISESLDVEDRSHGSEMIEMPGSSDVTDTQDRAEITDISQISEDADSQDSQEIANVPDIPDIPIPQDFITVEPESERQGYMEADPVYRRNAVRQRRVYAQEETDEEPEQLISKRGIIVVVLVVIFFFAIAVGACVMALQGGEPEVTGSAVSDINFSYEESDG